MSSLSSRKALPNKVFVVVFVFVDSNKVFTQNAYLLLLLIFAGDSVMQLRLVEVAAG